MFQSHSAEGWQPEQPCLISYGEYKLGNDYEIFLGQPAAVDTTLGTSGVDTEDSNKVWLKPYDDNTGVEECNGVAIDNRFARRNANELRLGMGGFRRDLRLIQWGLIPMLHVSGESEITFKTPVAPAPGGFRAWQSGMKKLGFFWQYKAAAEQMALVFIMPSV